MKFIPFPKIGQYSEVIQQIISEERFVGLDANKDPIYDKTKILPTVTFKGTVKLHGTNSAIVVQGDEYWCQSRENIITPTQDNYGFASYFHGDEKINAVKALIGKIKQKYKINDPNKIILLFGEWVGPNVQKNVAISELSQKSFFLFGIRAISPNKIFIGDNQEGVYESDKWFPINDIRDSSINFYNILDYPSISLEIDLNNPKNVESVMQGYVDAIEKQCSVAMAFGKTGLGEGLVWEAEWKGVRRLFKTKGKEHAATAHKDGKTVHADPEKVKGIEEFCNYCVTESRLNQAVEKIYNTGPLKSEKIGAFIKWMVDDIAKEEINVISSNNLSVKEVQGEISKRSREWLLKKIKEM